MAHCPYEFLLTKGDFPTVHPWSTWQGPWWVLDGLNNHNFLEWLSAQLHNSPLPPTFFLDNSLRTIPTATIPIQKISSSPSTKFCTLGNFSIFQRVSCWRGNCHVWEMSRWKLFPVGFVWVKSVWWKSPEGKLSKVNHPSRYCRRETHQGTESLPCSPPVLFTKCLFLISQQKWQHPLLNLT